MERVLLTKSGILALNLPMSGKRRVVYDSKVPKLALRVTSSGARTFYVVKRSGKMDWIRLGSFPDLTVEQARNEALKVLAEFARGDDPAAVKRARRSELTFEQAFLVYLRDKRRRDGSEISEKTKRDYSDLVRLHLSRVRTVKLSEIDRAKVKAAHASITRKSPAQADKAVAVISAVYSHAREAEAYGGTNPAAGVKKNPSVQRDRFLNSSEIPRFFEALYGVANDASRDLILLALLTGARRANVAAMRWADLHLDEGYWRIAKTKNGTPQDVTLSPLAVSVLQARAKSCPAEEAKILERCARRELHPIGFVFPSAGKSGHILDPRKAWERLLVDASLADFRFHDLRRTLGSWQARTGASLPVIGKSLNHKTVQATQIYARLDLDPVRDSVNIATEAMMTAAGVSLEGVAPSKYVDSSRKRN